MELRSHNERGALIDVESAVLRVAVVMLLALGGVFAAGWSGSPAAADVPSPRVDDPFEAPACVGATLDDPRAAVGPVSNLRMVFGDRLDAYNEGAVVPLYDAYGGNETEFAGGGYPAVCGVRYDSAANGPISEWMFCTDYYSLVCAGVNADGALVDKDGNVLPAVTPLPGNAKLDAQGERLVVALIHGIWDYTGVGSFDLDVSEARSDGSSDQRAALQHLIWCVTDPVAPGATGSEADRAATCEASMPATKQAEILASIPDDPQIAVTAELPAADLPVDTSATFVVDTNVLHKDITLAVTGPGSGLTVVSGPATLDGTTLRVTGTDAVRLAITGTDPGEVGLAAATDAIRIEHARWHQSQRTDGRQDCQVYATLFDEPTTVQSSATASFVREPTEPIEPTEPAEPTDPAEPTTR